MKDTLMTNQAFVIERTANGLIVRPHASWYYGGDHKPYPVDQVYVFTTYADFTKWFKTWFPAEEA